MYLTHAPIGMWLTLLFSLLPAQPIWIFFGFFLDFRFPFFFETSLEDARELQNQKKWGDLWDSPIGAIVLKGFD